MGLRAAAIRHAVLTQFGPQWVLRRDLIGQGRWILAGYPVTCDREAVDPPDLPFGRVASIRTSRVPRKLSMQEVGQRS
jgi:hypothetical protein